MFEGSIVPGGGGPRRSGDFMAVYAEPLYSREQVNRAGADLRNIATDPARDYSESFRIVDNFRVAHQFPLNTFYMTLRNRAFKVASAALVSQRTKRLPSILQKLLDRPSMKLSQMQDIAGCRAVVPKLEDAYELRDHYLNKPLVHPFAGVGPLLLQPGTAPPGAERDYILEPADTGYRSIHLKFRFNGGTRSAAYTGLKVEMQIRTLLQHQWATAVETAGTFTKVALKSNKGQPHWLRFFALMGSMLAIKEGTPVGPDMPNSVEEIREELRHLNRTHYIIAAFENFKAVIPSIEQQRNAFYYLIELDPRAPSVKVIGFTKQELITAHAAYSNLEKSHSQDDDPTQVVLVSVKGVAALRRAYPSYFLDTVAFIEEVREVIA